MSFTQKSFGPISSHGNSDMPNIWTYTTTDSGASLLGDSYFLAKHPMINDGDLIYAQPSDSPLFGKFRKTDLGYTVDPLVGPGSISGNRILITKVEDFDDYNDEVITLTTGITYDIAGIVDIGVRCMVFSGSTTLQSTNTSDNAIISSCPTAMLTGGGNYVLKSLRLEALVGPIYEIVQTIPSIIVMDSFVHIGAMGNITGVEGVTIFMNLGSFDSSISPMTFKGAWTRIEMTDVFPRRAAIESGEIMMDFASDIVILERIMITNSYAVIADGGIGYRFNGLSGIGNEAIQVSDNNFTGLGVPIAGLVNDDNQGFYNGNIGLTDTLPNGIWSIEDNVQITPIVTIGVGVVIVAPVIEINRQRFTIDTVQNKLTYTGARIRAFSVSGAFVLETSASNQRIGVRVKLNGVDTAISFTTTTSGAAGNRIENLSVNGVLGVNPGDIIEASVFNLSSTGDIAVLDAEFQLVSLT